MKRFAFVVACIMVFLAAFAATGCVKTTSETKVVTPPFSPTEPPVIPPVEPPVVPTGSITFGQVMIYKGNPDCTLIKCESVTLLKVVSCGDNQVVVPRDANLQVRMFLAHGGLQNRRVVVSKSIAGLDTMPADDFFELGSVSPVEIKLPGAGLAFCSKSAGNSWHAQAVANEYLASTGATIATQQCVVTLRVQ